MMKTPRFGPVLNVLLLGRTDDSACSTDLEDDPLRWFGMMVSPQLRAAQKDFRAALHLVVHLANRKYQLGALLVKDKGHSCDQGDTLKE